LANVARQQRDDAGVVEIDEDRRGSVADVARKRDKPGTSIPKRHETDRDVEVRLNRAVRTIDA
jgi:hypothetical protein